MYRETHTESYKQQTGDFKNRGTDTPRSRR